MSTFLQQAQEEERKRIEEQNRKIIEYNKKLEEEEKLAEQVQDNSLDVFGTEIDWETDFSFSLKDPNATYNETCPNGGDGGLVCCDDCSRKYNEYLTMTFQDLETQRLKHESEEVKEIAEYMKEIKDEMKEVYDAAKKIPPPTQPKSVPDPESVRDRNRQEWNATSTMDVASETAKI
jgi:hypothetical protein